jgi:hypothetical protein
MGVVAYLLLENGDYLLQEDGGKLDLEPLEYIVVAQNGSYTLTGQAAAIYLGKVVLASAGSYSLEGQNATIARGKLLVADAGAYTLNGENATIQVLHVVNAQTGQYALSGQNADVAISGQPVPAYEQAYIKLRSFTEHRRF